MAFEFVNPREARCGDVWVNPHTNMESDASDVNAVLRHYLCDPIEVAITKWGKISDQSAARRAAEVVRALEEIRASRVFEIFFLDTTGYLALVFADEPEKGAAFINPGHIDHYINAPWSIAHKSKPGIWRTYLPNSRQSGPIGGSFVVEKVSCPNDAGFLVPVTGECGYCGWRPSDDVVDYD